MNRSISPLPRWYNSVVFCCFLKIPLLKSTSFVSTSANLFATQEINKRNSRKAIKKVLATTTKKSCKKELNSLFLLFLIRFHVRMDEKGKRFFSIGGIKKKKKVLKKVTDECYKFSLPRTLNFFFLFCYSTIFCRRDRFI